MVLVDIRMVIAYPKYAVVPPIGNFGVFTMTPGYTPAIFVDGRTSYDIIDELIEMFPSYIICRPHPEYIPYTEEQSKHVIEEYKNTYTDINGVLNLAYLLLTMNDSDLQSRDGWMQSSPHVHNAIISMFGPNIKIRLGDGTVIEISE
jgi:hypothetical protein